MGIFSKGKEEVIQRQRYTQPQQDLINQLIGGLGGQNGALGNGMTFLNNLLGGETNEQATAPMMRQFQEQTVPQLAERFAGQDAMNSSAFGQSLSSAGAGLQENMFNARNQQQQQGLQALMQMLGQSQQQMFDTEISNKKGSGSMFGKIAGGLIGSLVPIPGASAAGASIGGSLF